MSEVQQQLLRSIATGKPMSAVHGMCAEAPGEEMRSGILADLPVRMHELFDVIKLEPAAKLSKRPLQATAKFEDVWQHMHTGDGLWYAGITPNALLIRISDYGPVSHAGTVLRDSDDMLRGIRNMDVIESWAWKKGGGRNLPLYDQVKAKPKRWCWAPVTDEYLEVDKNTHKVRFNRNDAERVARDLIGCTYGWRGIGLMAMTRLPIAREITYALYCQDINTPWEHRPPFCSWAQSLIAQGGGIDPVPELAPQLTSPTETFRSLLWGTKIWLN